MTFNPDLKYSKSHEWVRMDGDVAVIGISDFAQDAGISQAKNGGANTPWSAMRLFVSPRRSARNIRK